MSPTDPRQELTLRLRDQRLADRFIFHGPVPDSEIEAAERRLGVRFPDDYRWFLREFGPAELDETIYGVGDGAGPSVEAATLAAREKEPPLPPHFVVIGETPSVTPATLTLWPAKDAGASPGGLLHPTR